MSKREDVIIKSEEIENQKRIMLLVNNINSDGEKYAFVETYGCAQNVNDSEHLLGMLEKMGYKKTDDKKRADVIIYNTCAVRENAELKVFGNIGALKALKRDKPNLIIGVCGCMMQQEHIVEQIKKRYKHVDIVFGTHSLYRFPEILYNAITKNERVIDFKNEDGKIAEDLPIHRDGAVSEGVSVMYGCNNFCTYCIVPYVRGRERSRKKEDIIKEAKDLAKRGVKEIMLLGQNVNSYGKDIDAYIDFPDLLNEVSKVEGIERIRFMTSHPKDASPKLFSAMAECDKVAKQLHLPFQSGSDEILRRMNRRYTAEHYKSLIADAREKMPDITLSSDIIVGFPGETDEDFEQTLRLVQDTRFDLLFTFLYSPRTGTPAASYEDNASPQDKQRRFERLLKTQDDIVAEKQAAYQGKTLRLLVDGAAKGPDYPYTARTEGNLLVCVRGENIQIGEFIQAEIEKTSLRCLFAVKKS